MTIKILTYRKHKKKHKRDESLLEMHEKKLKKKKKASIMKSFLRLGYYHKIV
jgi:hypothetical protein